VGEGSVTALVKILESQFHSYFLWQMKQRADFERKKEKKKIFETLRAVKVTGSVSAESAIELGIFT